MLNKTMNEQMKVLTQLSSVIGGSEQLSEQQLLDLLSTADIDASNGTETRYLLGSKSDRKSQILKTF